MFVTVDKHQRFKSFYQSKDIYQAWSFVQQYWKGNFKTADYCISTNCGLRCFQLCDQKAFGPFASKAV